MSDTEHSKLVGRIRAELDASVEQLDARTRQDLARARRQAVAAARQPARPRLRPAWGGALALAAGLVLALVVVMKTGTGTGPVTREPVVAEVTPAAAVVPVDDLALLESDEALPMMQDLEFLLWLDDDKLDG